MFLWIVAAFLCVAWLLIYYVMNRETSVSESHPPIWHFQQWVNRYQQYVALRDQWRSTRTRSDHENLNRFEAEFASWSAETQKELKKMNLQTEDYLLTYAWGEKEYWEYLNGDLQEYLERVT